MKSISLREFQLKASSYFNDLPVILTVYNKPIAIVHPYGGEQIENSSNVPVVENFKSVVNSTNIYKGMKSGEYIWEWCQANYSHPFEKGKLRECLKVTVVDGITEDNAYLKGKFFVDKFMCKECIEKVNSTEGLGLKEGQNE